MLVVQSDTILPDLGIVQPIELVRILRHALFHLPSDLIFQHIMKAAVREQIRKIHDLPASFVNMIVLIICVAAARRFVHPYLQREPGVRVGDDLIIHIDRAVSLVPDLPQVLFEAVGKDLRQLIHILVDERRRIPMSVVDLGNINIHLVIAVGIEIVADRHHPHDAADERDVLQRLCIHHAAIRQHKEAHKQKACRCRHDPAQHLQPRRHPFLFRQGGKRLFRLLSDAVGGTKRFRFRLLPYISVEITHL